MLELQEELIIFRADFTRLKLSHYPLVIIIVIGGIVSESRLPVLVRAAFHEELMLLMIFPFEAQLAHFHLLAKHALQLCLILQDPLATVALK